MAASDDAYLVGEDLVSGMRVAIAKRGVDASFYGERVIFLTPDEGRHGSSAEPVGVVKPLWRGAEIISVKRKEAPEGRAK